MDSLNIATDFGASLGKAIYEGSSGDPSLILLKPEIIGVPSSSIEAYQKSFSFAGTHPEETAWLEVKGQSCFLGELARHRFRMERNLNEPKYNKAIYQCLAIIGSAIQREKVKVSKLNLAIVLPFDEFRYKETFEEQLREGLKSFSFRGQDYSLKLDQFRCLPEGSGLYLRGRQSNGAHWLASHKDITIALVMMGYRNISLMVMEKGIPKVTETTMQGFAQMIELIKQRVPVVDEQALIKAMSKSNGKQRQKAFDEIAVCDDEQMRKKEIEKLVKAIKDAKEEYLNLVTSFFNANLKSFTVDEFVIGGGTANYLRSELRKYFLSWGAENISWTETLERRIRQTFGEKIARESLEYRLGDVYGLLYFLLDQPLPKIKRNCSYEQQTSQIFL
jgi:hypothetical protein